MELGLKHVISHNFTFKDTFNANKDTNQKKKKKNRAAQIIRIFLQIDVSTIFSFRIPTPTFTQSTPLHIPPYHL